MFGGDPSAPRPRVTEDDVHLLRAQVVALQELVAALIDSHPKPPVLRASIRKKLDVELGAGLSQEHWRPDEHDEVVATFDEVLGPDPRPFGPGVKYFLRS